MMEHDMAQDRVLQIAIVKLCCIICIYCIVRPRSARHRTLPPPGASRSPLREGGRPPARLSPDAGGGASRSTTPWQQARITREHRFEPCVIPDASKTES